MAYSAEWSSRIWLEGLVYRVMWTAMQGPNDEDVKRQVMTARRDCEGEREPERLSLMQCLHLSAWLGRGAEPVNSRAQSLSPARPPTCNFRGLCSHRVERATPPWGLASQPPPEQTACSQDSRAPASRHTPQDPGAGGSQK